MKTGTHTPDGSMRLYHLPHNTGLFDGMRLGTWTNPDDGDILMKDGSLINGDCEWDRLKAEASLHGFRIETDDEGIVLHVEEED